MGDMHGWIILAIGVALLVVAKVVGKSVGKFLWLVALGVTIVGGFILIKGVLARRGG